MESYYKNEDINKPTLQDTKDASAYAEDEVPASDVNFYLPRIEAAHVFRMNNDNLRIRPIAGFQMYEVEDSITGDDEDIISYLLGLGVSADVGDGYVKWTGSYMQNSGNYGDFNIGTTEVVTAVPGEDDYEDQQLYQTTLVGGYNVSEDFLLEAGVGYMDAEVDTDPGVTEEQAAMVYYLQGNYQVAEGIDFVPEIGVLDRGDLEVTGDDDTDQGKLSYANVALVVSF